MNKHKHHSQKIKFFSELKRLYAQMEADYNRVAQRIGLDCQECPDNCCVSYFQHHTYIEWAYLWHGLQHCSADQRARFLHKAQEYLEQCELARQRGERPEVMCPLNEEGRCAVYSYRLMICRFHGVPNQVRMPNGALRQFPGCVICRQHTANMIHPPVLDRTPAYIQLAELERKFIKTHSAHLSKVDLTLAEMLVQGPPKLE